MLVFPPVDHAAAKAPPCIFDITENTAFHGCKVIKSLIFTK